MTWDLKRSLRSHSSEAQSSSRVQPMGVGPRGARSQRQSRRSKRRGLKDSLRNSIAPERSQKPRPQQDALSWMLRNGALLMTLCLTLWVSGCCGAGTVKVATVDPLLPPGRPSSSVTQEIAEALSRIPTTSPTESVKVPLPLLRKLNGHLDAWRAYAKALETAGHWRAE